MEFYGKEIIDCCKRLGLSFSKKCSTLHNPSYYAKHKLPGTASHIFSMTGVNIGSISKFTYNYKKHSVINYTGTDLEIFYVHYMTYCKPLGYSIDDYFSYQLFNKSPEERSTFISEYFNYRMRAQFNKGQNLLNKFKYNSLLKGVLIHRDFVYPNSQNYNTFIKFYNDHEIAFCKPCKKSFGIGARKIKLYDYKPKKLYALCKRNDWLLEELVIQHPDVAALNNTSLNTIRVHTIYEDGEVNIISVSGRIGKSGAIIDNFRGGGFGVTVDKKTGRIMTDAVDAHGHHYTEHPDSGVVFEDYTYPCWDKVVEAVTEGAKIMTKQGIRHVGWDVAITEDEEIEIIEMNAMPGCTIPQTTTMEGLKPRYLPYLNLKRTSKTSKKQTITTSPTQPKRNASAYENMYSSF